MVSLKQKSEAMKEDSGFDKAIMPDSELVECQFADALTNDDAIEKKKANGRMEEVPGMARKVTFIFWENLCMIIRVVTDQCKGFGRGGGRGDMEGTTRLYQIWPGKNVFFCRGRLVCGPDPRGLLFTTYSIIASSCCFAFYGGNDLPISRSSLIIIIAFSVILTITVLASLILVATTDPGIIPRNDHESVEEVGTSRGIKRKTVLVNGVELKLQYCRTCKIFRPPRSCHCVVCDNCVDKFDHHCPWIGQCIGLRNYRLYLTCICSALLFYTYVFAFSGWRLHWKTVKAGSGLAWIARNSPETLALSTLSFIAVLHLSSLTVFHLYLIAINQTGYENIWQRYEGSKNPYHKGKISNMKEVLFMPLPPPRVDFRAEVISGSYTQMMQDKLKLARAPARP